MAQFKEVTRPGGAKVTIDVDKIVMMERKDPNTTVIYFAKDDTLQVTEEPLDVLRPAVGVL